MATPLPAVERSAGCTVLVYRDRQLRDDVPFEQIDQVIAAGGSLVWLDVERPSADEFQLIAREFRLHPLAIEDIGKAHQRPKLDQYEDSRLVVLFDMQLTPQHRRVALHEVDLFVGASFLVSVHRFPVPAIRQLQDRWRRHPDLVEPHPMGLLLYHLADELVDGYFPIVDALEARIEGIEDRVFGPFDSKLIREIFTIRRDLIQIRRILGPERDLFNMLARREDTPGGADLSPYFSDIVDLLLRLTDTVDTLRDLLSAALETFLTVQSNALNVAMRRLTAWTVALMLPTLIAGIYGMNYPLVPSGSWPYGFWFAVALMLAGAGLVLALFKRQDWL